MHNTMDGVQQSNALGQEARKQNNAGAVIEEAVIEEAITEDTYMDVSGTTPWKERQSRVGNGDREQRMEQLPSRQLAVGSHQLTDN